MSILHYWPENLSSDLPSSPLTVLKEAAVELGQATKGAIEAIIKIDESRSTGNQVEYDFVLVAKSLGFRYTLFGASFGKTKFYPCNMGIPSGSAVNTIVHSEGELREKLTEYLKSERVVSVVKALLAQSLAA